MKRFKLLCALLVLVMISISCGGSESSNENCCPLKKAKARNLKRQRQAEKSPEAGEDETPASETTEEKTL
ncbi:MAG: hypothetical protein ACJ0F6_01360 [Acidimicrobiales bacterium]